MGREKNITDTKGWFYLALGCVAVSILSLFLPIFRSHGENFNILALLDGGSDFNRLVINNYSGPVVWNLTSETVAILAVVAIGALICTVIGLVTLRAQRPNTWNFVLTFVGLIGILIPSVTAIVCVSAYGRYFGGGLVLGIAPVISPIAIVVSLCAVIRRRNRIAEERQKEAERRGLIYKAGDL